METQSLLLVPCQGYPLETVDSPHKGPQYVYYISFVVSLDKLLNKQSIFGWYETPWHSSHRNEYSGIHGFQSLATPQAFASNPSLVWEFYHYRRDVMGSKEPNKVRLHDCRQDHLSTIEPSLTCLAKSRLGTFNSDKNCVRFFLISKYIWL